MTPAAIKKMLEPVFRRLQLAIGRAVVRAIDDSKKMQSMQLSLLADEVRDTVERFQNYGFTSCPIAGAEAVVVFPSGNRDHGLIIACDDRRYRLKGLQNGEVAMYSDEGDYIHFKRGRNLEVKTETLFADTKNAHIKASVEVKIETPKASFTNDVEIAGTLKVSGNISSISGEISDVTGTMKAMREIYNSHRHQETETTTFEPDPQM